MWCPNRLHHIILLDVPAAPWRENNIFGFFGVRHANRGQTKYSINNGDKEKEGDKRHIMHYKLVVGVPMSFGVMGDKDKETK